MSEKPSKKVWIIVIAAVLVLALAVGAIAFFGRNNQANNGAEQPGIEQNNTGSGKSEPITSNPVETYVEPGPAPEDE